jgi:glycosyltransferase involved in cell wall biosynthesis
MSSVTVAIPTYNRPGFLARAVRSVLDQTFQDFELIILDNGSADSSWRAWPELADPRIRLICHVRNIGVIDNWNAAVAEARGDSICIFHDDDVMQPRFLEVTLASLGEHPSAGLVFTKARRTDCLSRPMGIWRSPKTAGVMSGRDYILATLRSCGSYTIPSSALIRKAAYAAVGPYDGRRLSSFDVNYFLRLAMQFDIAFVDEVLVDYTLHPCQISEEIWRAQRLEGFADASLEMLSAATWLLHQPVLPDETRHEIATILEDINQKLGFYVQHRTMRTLVF